MKLEQILATVDPIINDSVIVGECAIVTSEKHFDPTHLMLASRHALDKTRMWEHARQIIPYIVVQNEDGKVLTYTRTIASGDERLHNSVSIGWGGHIDLEDVVTKDSIIDVPQTIFKGATRELHEELGLGIKDYVVHVCRAGTVLDPDVYIISDEDAVGRVHIGVVYYATIPNDFELNVEKTGKLMGYKTLEEIAALDDALEGWTRALVSSMLHNNLKLPALV